MLNHYQKFILITLLFFTIIISGQAQSWQWERLAGSKGASDYGKAIARDAEGNLIVAGRYAGEAIFSGQILTNMTSTDIFLAKYNSDGTIIWVKSSKIIGAIEVAKMEIDSEGNILLLLCDNPAYRVNTFAKYDSFGNLLWKKNIISTIPEAVYFSAFNFDASGNIFVAGVANNYFTQLDDVQYFPYGGYFIFKFSPDGKVLSSKVLSKEVEVHTMQMDNSGNFYFSNVNSLLKFSNTGDFIWEKKVLNVATRNLPKLFINENKDIYYSFSFWNDIEEVNGKQYISSGAGDIALIKLDSLGNVQWTKTFGGNGLDQIQDVDIDKNGSIYFTGTYENNATFGTYQLKSTNKNIFIVKCDSKGNVIYAKSSGSDSGDEALGIVSDDQGNAFITGKFFNHAVFDDDTLQSSGFSDIFIGKLSCTPYVAGTIVGDTLVCEGNSNYSIAEAQGASFSWIVNDGGIITSSGNVASINWTKAGIFTITVTPSNNCGIGKAKTLKVRVKAIPVKPTIIGNTTTCIGTSAYSITKYPEETYAWSLSNGGSLVAINNTSVVNWTNTGSYTLSVIATNSCGNSPVSNSIITVDKIPNQPSTISGNNNSCLGNQLYTVTPNAGTNYNWSLGSGGSIITQNHLSNVNWTIPGVHSISVSPYNHCGIGQAQILNVTIKDVPAQPSAIAGNSPVCKGSQTYNIIETPGTNYVWTLTTGGALSPMKGAANVQWVEAGSHLLTVVASNECGAGTARTKLIQVNDIPTQPDSIKGLKQVCIGSQIYMVPLQANTNYAWSISGGGNLLPNTNTSQVNWTNAGTNTLTVTPFNNCGYGPSTSLVVSVNNTSAQINKINGKDKACITSEIYNVTSIPGFTYNWSLSEGGILSPTGNSATILWQETGIHTLNVTTSDGCTNSLPVIVNDIPSAPATLTGDPVTCLGNKTYSVPFINEENYNWNLSGGGTIISAYNTASIDWNATGLYTITVTPSNYCGNGPATNKTIHVIDKPAAPSTISGSSIACLDTITYKLPKLSGLTYTWFIDNGGILQSMEDSAIVIWKNTGNYLLSAKATNECGSSPSTSKAIQIVGIPSLPTISGDSLSCLENKKYFIVKPDKNETYHWSINGGGNLISYNDSSSIQWNTTGNYYIKVISENSCSTAPAIYFKVNINTLPATITSMIGDTIPCVGIKNYQVTSSQSTHYIWGLSGGGNISSTENYATINWLNSGKHSISITPYNRCGNGTTVNYPIRVSTIPSQPSLIAGQDSSCLQIMSYHIESMNGINYIWTLSGNGELINETNSYTIKVQWKDIGTHTLRVTPFNLCGTGPSRNLNIKVSDVPNQLFPIDGSSTICEGSSNTYSTTNLSGVKYNWNFSGPNESNSSLSNFQIKPLQAGEYKVTVIPYNSCGNGLEQELNIKVKNKPLLQNPIIGDEITCSDNTSIYSLKGNSYDAYQWFTKPSESNLTIINDKVKVNWASSGHYTLYGYLVNECGNSDTASIDITVENNSLQPAIKKDGDTLISTISGQSIWTHNGVELEENTSKLTYPTPGEYTVQSVNSCGPSKKSETYIISEDKYYGFPVIPNPAENMVTIKVPIYLQWKKIQLIDGLGQVVKENDNLNQVQNSTFDIRDITEGIYVFRIYTELGIFSEKLIKIK